MNVVLLYNKAGVVLNLDEYNFGVALFGTEKKKVFIFNNQIFEYEYYQNNPGFNVVNIEIYIKNDTDGLWLTLPNPNGDEKNYHYCKRRCLAYNKEKDESLYHQVSLSNYKELTEYIFSLPFWHIALSVNSNPNVWTYGYDPLNSRKTKDLCYSGNSGSFDQW